jgi:uncharacterized membrane protein
MDREVIRLPQISQLKDVSCHVVYNFGWVVVYLVILIFGLFCYPDFWFICVFVVVP